MPEQTMPEARLQSAWSTKHVYAMAVVSLFVGLLAGYLLRGTESASPSAATQQAPPAEAQTGPAGGGAHPMPTMEQMKQMADSMAAPLAAKLKTDPNNPKLLAQLGALYNKTHQFKAAGMYYEKALRVDPKNVEMRNELASCLYYTGDVDGALHQLEQSLKDDPNNVNALFNLGMIRWKGKHDSAGAIAAWQQLLKKNPGLDRKPIVEKMIAEASTQGAALTVGSQGALDHAR